MNIQQEMNALSRALNLEDERQDWGIANSDSSRVEEFIRFCETAQLTPSQQFAMGELVLASANDAIMEGVVGDDFNVRLERFLASRLHGLPRQVEYWSSLKDEEEFPIAARLRQLATHAY